MADQTHRSASAIRRAAHEWRVRLSEPGVCESDRRAFETWRSADPRHEDAYDRAVTFWEAMGRLSEDDYDPRVFRPAARERRGLIVCRARTLFKQARFRVTAAAAGAAAMAAAVTIFAVSTRPTTPMPIEAAPVMAQYETTAGETITVMLKDGTVVTLGPATAIDVALRQDARDVRIEAGAAFFEVARDETRPFSVRTGDLTATALGTAFDVRNNGGAARVAVAEGQVRVSYPFMVDRSATSLALKRNLQAGEQVLATPAGGLGAPQAIPPDAVGAWRNQRLVYADATLGELVADADRYSERKIALEDPDGAISALEVTISVDARDVEGLLALFPDMFPVSVEDRGPDGVLVRPRHQAR